MRLHPVWFGLLVILAAGFAPHCRDATPEDEARREAEKQLLQAAEKGDLPLVRALLEKGIDPNAAEGVDRYGTGSGPLISGPSPLQAAARRGHAEIVQALLDAGADPRRKGIGGEPDQRAFPWLGDGIRGPGWAREALAELRKEAEPTRFSCGHPLGAAALGGHATVVKLLVERAGISLDDRELQFSGKEDGWTALMWGALGGSEGVCAYLLEHGATPDLRSDEDGATSLHFAAARKSQAVCELLLNKGADPSAADLFGNTPLHDAAASDAAAACIHLLGKGANPRAANEFGTTPLHAAAAHRSLQSCREILSRKGNPNAVDWEGRSPLHFAALRGEGKICEELLIAGADPLAKTAYGESPLHLAAASGDLNTMLMLLQAGCPVDGPSALGYTPLHYAAAFDRQAAAAILVLRGASVKATAAEGFTPLHMAVLENAGFTTSLLLVLRADPDARDSEGWTPLHLAALKGRSEMELFSVPFPPEMGGTSSQEQAVAEEKRRAEAREKLTREPIARLLKYGADVHARNADGETPLHLAAYADRAEFCELLLGGGSDANAETREGLTPLDVALLASSDAAAEVVRRAGGRPGSHPPPEKLFTLLTKACREGNVEECQALLARGADPTLASESDLPPLYAAVEGKCAECVKLLIAHGADPRAPLPWGLNLLIEAITGGDDAVLETLLDAGAEVDSRNSTGRTALHLAATGLWRNTLVIESGHAEEVPRNSVQILLDHGADVNARDESGGTPLHEAAETGADEIATLLLDKGADPNVANEAGQTPLDIAVLSAKGSTAELLRSRDGREGRPASRALIRAVEESDLEKVAALLEEGSNPNLLSPRGRTPLQIATGGEDIPLMELLVADGALLDQASSRGDTALDMALHSEGESLRVAEWLLEHGAKGGRWGVHAMSPREADLLLRFGFPMEEPRYSWLGNAIYNAQTGFVKYLLDRGADPNYRAKDGSTPLHESVVGFEGSFDLAIVEALLRHGADPDARNDHGQTAAHYAAALDSAGWFSSKVFDERIPMLELLAAYGADLSLRDEDGKTPRDLARAHHGLGTAFWLRRWEIQKKLGLLPLMKRPRLVAPISR